MEMSSAQQLPIESVDQLESRELIKLIRKLRWIGMEREAELVTRASVGRLAISGAVAGPPDTD
jgi:hypothetical protein